MTKPIAGIFAFLLLALTTQFLRQLCGLVHMPDVISLIREPLLFLLFWWALLHLDFFIWLGVVKRATQQLTGQLPIR